MESTVMGKAVKVAARRSSAAKPEESGRGAATYAAIGKTGPLPCHARGRLTVRGATQPVRTYAVSVAMATHQAVLASMVGQLLHQLDAIV